MKTLSGKAVVITGAGSGIGRALTLEMARRGARLLICDVNASTLADTVSMMTTLQVGCESLVCDIAEESSATLLAARATALWGGADIVVNNAGVALVSPVESTMASDAQWLMGINFWSVVYCCRAFIPLLRGRNDATLVNVSSIFAMVSMPTQSMYNASKAAVRAFSDALREELRADRINVLCIHPGGVKTNIVNDARVLDPTMVAPSAQVMQRQFKKVARLTPEQAARQIADAIASGRTRLLVGNDARLLDLIYRVVPSRASALLARAARRNAQRKS